MTTLAQRLRDDCAKHHHQVEQHPFIQKLFSGNCTLELYGHYLARLAPVYEALEAGLRALPQSSPYQTLCLPVLYRSAPLAADLQVLGQQPETADAVPLAAYLAAVDHPQRLAAGFYVRYLGDLGGGQILARILSASLGLTDEAGLRFFRYPQVTVQQCRKQAKGALDALGEDVSQDPIVNAAQTIFTLHESVFPENNADLEFRHSEERCRL